MLAAQGYELDADDISDAAHARAYVGAIMQAEALAEIKGLRRDIITFLQALARAR